MRIDGPIDTSQVEDRSGGGGGGFGRPLAVGGGGLGIVGVIVVVLVQLLGGGGTSGYAVDGGYNAFPAQGAAQQTAPVTCAQGASTSDKCFIAGVVTDVQTSWTRQFEQAGKTYEKTKIILFTQQTSSGCGTADSATGPFYCPTDHKVYLDASFFDELKTKFGAPGDFAEAYVIAHEFGHHVQNQLGIFDQVAKLEQQKSGQENALSVRTELQADCLAGVWAHGAYSELQPGDIDEALAAAASVGDDRLQQQATGRVNPESFTHGTSAQRQKWFTAGQTSGNINDCDTFSGSV